jgi:hypothetical protein
MGFRMTWDEDIRTRFPDWKTDAALARWLSVRQELSLENSVKGEVIARAPFGVWIDIGIDRPALLLVPEIKGAREKAISFDEYPLIGSSIEARIIHLSDRGDISLSQQLLPPIGNSADLRVVLEAELGYCTCVSDDAIPLLRDILRLAKARSESLNDIELFKRESQALEDRRMHAKSPGLASWFVHGLERAELVHHNYNVTDLWITNKGRALLRALEEFPNPALLMDEETNEADKPD